MKNKNKIFLILISGCMLSGCTTQPITQMVQTGFVASGETITGEIITGELIPETTGIVQTGSITSLEETGIIIPPEGIDSTNDSGSISRENTGSNIQALKKLLLSKKTNQSGTIQSTKNAESSGLTEEDIKLMERVIDTLLQKK